MEFPACDRMVFERNPLQRVSCELRFNPILRIGSEQPTRVQEVLASRLPTVDIVPVPSPRIQQGEVDSRTLRISVGTSPSYRFSATDERMKLVLSQGSIVFSQDDYQSWTDFERTLDSVFRPVLEEYHISDFTRVGLRYQNLIDRTVIDMAGVPWKEILSPQYLGFMTQEQESDVKEWFASCCLVLGEQGDVCRLKYGLADSLVTSNLVFAIDSDFSNSRGVQKDALWAKLQYFNEQASRLFRAAISHRTRDALRPRA